jgi:pSer/pThr/pTyr-binding forkhead associated (FHA) protein
VPAELEVWTLSGRRHVELTGDRVTIGKGEQNDLVVDADPTVSRLHAVLERFPAGWCVTDLGSSNGTTLNGERIWAQQRLRHGDEVRVGRTRLLFRNSSDVGPRARRARGAVPAVARPRSLHRAGVDP